MSDLLNQLRSACALVAERAKHVHVERERIPAYVGTLPIDLPEGDPDPEAHLIEGTREELAAFWLTLDSINFGSGWFPTLHKRPGRSGYFTIATALRDRFAAHGPWPASELARIGAGDVAAALGQDPEHELMALYARSLNDLGRHVSAYHAGHFVGVVDAAGELRGRAGSAPRADGRRSPIPRATTACRSRSSSAPRSPPSIWPGPASPPSATSMR